MGKKVDLSARRASNSRTTKNNRNSSHFRNNAINSPSQEEISSSTEENQNNAGLGASSFQRRYDPPKKAHITIKIPLAVKVSFAAMIIGLPLIGLMLFVIIFNEENESTDSGLYGLGQTCETVSVTDTENYKYDEDISFNEYVEGVVAAESNSSNNLEYLKLLAIYARTYFFENASSSCEVAGNANFQKYMDVDDSSNKELVKQAVEETKDLVITRDGELLKANYSAGCLVNEDSSSYYIRYEEFLTGEKKYQQVPKEWVAPAGFESDLNNLFQNLDKSESDYHNRICPANTTDRGMSKIGALYLISNENYNYQEVIQYYNGIEVEIIKNEIKYHGNGEFINPTSTIVCSSPYGNRTNPTEEGTELHSGIDIALSQGTPVYATKDGKITNVVKSVTRIGNCDDEYGNYVIIDHGNGISTLYGHMKYGTIPDSIYIGASVSQGDQIGKVGSTGCSTGYHLHYEVRENNLAINPADYLDLTNASGKCQ